MYYTGPWPEIVTGGCFCTNFEPFHQNLDILNQFVAFSNNIVLVERGASTPREPPGN